MSETIEQLMPAPPGLMLVYAADGENEDSEAGLLLKEPVVCLALVRRGTKQSVVPMSADGADGVGFADTAENYLGIAWHGATMDHFRELALDYETKRKKKK